MHCPSGSGKSAPALPFLCYDRHDLPFCSLLFILCEIPTSLTTFFVIYHMPSTSYPEETKCAGCGGDFKLFKVVPVLLKLNFYRTQIRVLSVHPFLILSMLCLMYHIITLLWAFLLSFLKKGIDIAGQTDSYIFLDADSWWFPAFSPEGLEVFFYVSNRTLSILSLVSFTFFQVMHVLSSKISVNLFFFAILQSH